jgi:hypothetical protein
MNNSSLCMALDEVPTNTVCDLMYRNMVYIHVPLYDMFVQRGLGLDPPPHQQFPPSCSTCTMTSMSFFWRYSSVRTRTRSMSAFREAIM